MRRMVGTTTINPRQLLDCVSMGRENARQFTGR
jgi:hypothetical protein